MLVFRMITTGGEQVRDFTGYLINLRKDAQFRHPNVMQLALILTHSNAASRTRAILSCLINLRKHVQSGFSRHDRQKLPPLPTFIQIQIS